ncbi:MAG: hypothetical protein ABID04_02515, partial [Patescibacteria group bacterium]
MFKKYQSYLDSFANQEKSLPDRWLLFLTDLKNEAESYWDYNSIRYGVVMTKKQWTDFVDHPQRKPYRTKLAIGDSFDQRFDFIIQVLTDSYGYYQKLKKSRLKGDLADGMAALLDSILSAKYYLEQLRAV